MAAQCNVAYTSSHLEGHMHMIYLGITIATGIYVYAMMTNCWISSYTSIIQHIINDAHFDIILSRAHFENEALK